MIRLYVDEQGTDTLNNLHKDKHRYLSLTGVAMKVEHARDQLVPAINSLKADLFNDDPDAQIILHRNDIMGGKGPFERIRSDEDFRNRFDERLCAIFREAEYTVITALIDKDWMMRQKHWERRHPYHYLLEILVEKFVQYLEKRGRDIGDIMPESRQEKDSLLQTEYDRIRTDGTSFVNPERIASVLRGPNLKFRKKKENIAGLQLCDLLAHPSHIYVRERMGHDVQLGKFAKIVCQELIERKYDRSGFGTIRGYGFKHLP